MDGKSRIKTFSGLNEIEKQTVYIPEMLPPNLFLNVHPKLLVSVNAHGQVFERILHAHSVPTHKVVIEIAENAVDADKPLLEAVGNYRDRGYHIAIDDFGGRRSNLDRLWKLAPDYVKLDISLIQEA